VIRLVVAGLTVGTLAVSGLVAVAAMGALLAAIGVMYFLVTEVLGLRLDIDPNAFLAHAQRYARGSAN
jgi:hypothetical protein